MATLILKPTEIKAHGTIPKIILEYIGRVNSKTSEVSVAHMKSPGGWTEPGQTPKFNEYTVVLKGTLHVKTKTETLKIQAGQAVIAHAGQWVQYSSPDKDGAEYIAVCVPAFSPDSVHRDS